MPPDADRREYGAARDGAVDIYAVADQLQEKGWSVDRQQDPPSVHCTVSSANVPVISRYLDDLREAVAHVVAHPELARQGEAAVYGLLAKVPADRYWGAQTQRCVCLFSCPHPTCLLAN